MMKMARLRGRFWEMERNIIVEKMTTRECAAAMGVGIKAVKYWRPRLGISRQKEHPFDERFFAAIDTEGKAYWLGFVWADGHLTKDGNALILTLAGRDGAHVKKFAEALRCEKSVRDHVAGGYSKSSIKFNSAYMASDLERLGYRGHNAVEAPTPLPHIPPHLHRHFRRGLVDGDGSLTGSGVDISIFLCSPSRPIIEEFVNYCRGVVPTTKMRPYKHMSILCTRMTGKQSPMRVIASLYSGANVYLDRKMEKATKLVDKAVMDRSFGRQESWTTEDCHRHFLGASPPTIQIPLSVKGFSGG